MEVESKINNSKQHYWFAIILISILGIGLRLYQLDRPLGGGDENALLLYYGYTSFNYIISTYFDPDNHIFHTLLLNSMATLFGDNNAFAIRLPNFIFGIADLWMTYLLSFLIFRSRFISVITLLLVTINPVHIHYSQTARGYGIMMFFSTSVIYATLKLLNSEQIYKWSLVFVICGFLSIYTLPTNIYLFIGLAAWLSILVIHPFWGKEYNDDYIWKKKTAKMFFILYVVLVSLTLIAYSPIIDQMLETMKNHQLMRQFAGSKFYWILGLIPLVPQTIFPGLMQLFIPFIILGIIATKPVRNGYKWLLIFTFFVPFCFNLLVGTAGFPRNYFFTFSLINIFLAGGIISAGQWCDKKLPILSIKRFSSIVISIFTLIAFSETLHQYYEEKDVRDGPLYHEKVVNHANPLDFLLFLSHDYLYARTIYEKNFKNILRESKLEGIKAIARRDFIIKENIPPSESRPYDKKNIADLKRFIGSKQLDFQNLLDGLAIFNLTGESSISVLEEDYESVANWEVMSGQGKYKILEQPVYSGKTSISINSYSDENYMIRAKINKKIRIRKPSFMLLMWTSNSANRSSMVHYPMLTTKIKINNEVRRIQLNLNYSNNGIFIHLNRDSFFTPYSWEANAATGIILPGDYTFNIWLSSNNKETIQYDSFRLFFIEIKDDLLHKKL